MNAFNATLAAAVLVLSAATAHAAEGNGDPFPNAQSTEVRAQAFNDTGSAGYIRTTRPLAHLANAEALPQTGSEAEVATANALPVGAEEGTVAYAQARSVERWVQAHQQRPTRLALR